MTESKELAQRARELLSGVPLSMVTDGAQQWMTDVCAFLREIAPLLDVREEPVAFLRTLNGKPDWAED